MMRMKKTRRKECWLDWSKGALWGSSWDLNMLWMKNSILMLTHFLSLRGIFLRRWILKFCQRTLMKKMSKLIGWKNSNKISTTLVSPLLRDIRILKIRLLNLLWNHRNLKRRQNSLQWSLWRKHLTCRLLRTIRSSWNKHWNRPV